MTVSTHEALLDQLKGCRFLSADDLERAASLINDDDDSKSAARKLVSAGVITRWQAGQLLKGSKATLVLGKYVLLDRLPWGGSHAVFLAKHPTMDRKVALNVLDKTSSARSDAVKSFLADARAIATLDHRHLIHVFDIDEADNRYFLVMEHVEGRNLHDAVKASGTLSVESAANVVRQIADGLDHAHRSKLIHGGLRPTNVLLDAQGVVKIIDLGVSKFDDPTKPPPGTADDSQLLEVANFLSPEQAAGGAATAQSDLYSLGCVGYMLLTGEPPFGKGDYATRLANHQSESPPDVRTRRSEVPEPLSKILQKLMAKSTSDRYGSAKEVMSAIETWWTQYAAELEAARPKAKPKPQAKPPAPKGAAPVVAAKPASVGSKPAPAKPSPGKPAAVAPKSATPNVVAEVDAPAFPGINLQGRKSAAPPASKPAPARPKSNGSPAVSDESADLVETIPVLAAPKGSKSPPALPTKKAAGKTPVEPKFEAESPSPAASEKSTSKLPLILALVGGGVVLLLLLVGGAAAAYFLLGSDEPVQVAASTNPSDNAKTGDGDEPDAESSGSEEEAAGEEGEASDGDDPASASEEPGDDEGEPTTDPPVAPEAEPKDPVPPVEPPATDPPATDPPATKPDPPPTTEPPKEEPPKPQRPQEKPADPFVALAPAVALPSLKEEQKTPVALAAIAIPADSTCYIDLVGGDKAVPKEGITISMDLARGGLATRDWEIKLVGSPRGDINIATLALSETELTFQWTPDAAKIDEAGYLANCQLNLRTADHDRYLALRTPQEATALPVNINRASHREKFELPYAGSPDTIMVEIVKVDGVEKAAIDPKNVLSAKQDATHIWFGDGEDRVLGLRIDAQMQKDLQLMVSPVINDPVNGPTKFVLKKLVALRAQMTAGVVRMNAQVQALEKHPNKDKLKDAIAKAKQQLEAESKSLDIFDKFEKQYEIVNGKASVQFRVYFTDGEHQVDLVRATQANAAVAPPAGGEAVPQLDLDGDGK